MISKKYTTVVIITALLIMVCCSNLLVTGASNTLYYLNGDYDKAYYNSPQEMWLIDDNYMVVCAHYEHNVTIVDISDPENGISMVSTIHLCGIPRKLDVSDDKNYIFVGVQDNFMILNITDINNPTIEGNLSLGLGAYLCGLSYVDSTKTAFATDYNNDKLRSFNCDDKTNPTLISSVACGNEPHGVWANETIAFALGHKSDSVITYDVSDPSSMSLLDSYSSGNLHRCSAIWGEYAPYIYVGSLDSSASIFDISNPSDIVRKSYINFPGGQTCTATPNADERLMYVSWRGPGATNSILYAYNITDKTNPTLIDSISGDDPGVTFEGAAAGAQVVKSNYIFEGDAEGSPDMKGVGVFRFGDQINDTPTPPQFISIDGGFNGTTIYNSTPTFNWTIVSSASTYRLQIANDSAFTDLVVNLSDINEYNYPSKYDSNETRVSFILPVANSLDVIDKTYYCRVRSYT